MDQELSSTKQRERLVRVLESVKAYQDQQRQAYEFMAQTNKTLFGILEDIAEKEIERNPIEFIRKENQSIDKRGNDEFYSFDEDYVVDDEDEDNEYHNEEFAVGDRFTKYKNKKFGQGDDEGQKLRSPDFMEDPKLAEELDDIFHDAKDYLEMSNRLSRKADQSFYLQSHEEEKGEPDDPPEREVLPYFKDPKLKISIWTIIKDSIGKDITKMSVPVYFNDPTNILQKMAGSMEYNYILDQAVTQTDPLRRLAFVAIYSTTLLQSIERNTTKPFNPLLGETFELVTPSFKFIAEQVSHHPPISAFECQGASGYKVWSNNRAKTKFTGKSLNIIPMYRVYVELAAFNELYEIAQPTVSAHNLIIGNLYLDLGGKSIIRNCTTGELAELEYHKRGWSASSAYKVDGNVLNAKKEVVFRIEGKWSETVSLVNPKTGVSEPIYVKSPYPEKWEYMYGFTNFLVQLNYLPNFLRRQIAPTDTRFRPDQRALENGDMKTAAAEKNRLEEKQRAVRRFKEKKKLAHQTAYFEEWKNPEDDNQVYFRYNGAYFERDRKTRDWSRLPDLYSERFPPEIEEFLQNEK